MSTKIYQGFKIENCDAGRLFQELKQLRSKLQAIARAAYDSQFINNWITVAENHIANNSQPLSYSDMIKSRRGVIKEIQKGLAYPRQDYDCSVSFAAISPDTWLGILWCDQEDMRQYIKEQSWYSGYEYWNNTDKPDEISDEEWQTRSHQWAQLLGNTPVNHTMAEFKFASNNDFVHPRIEQLNAMVLDDECRVQRLTHYIAQEEYFKNVGGYTSTSDFLDKVEQFHKDCPPGCAQWLVHQKQASKIVEQVTVEYLFTMYN